MLRKKTDTPGAKSLIFRALGILFSVAPPALCVLFYFPLWESVSGKLLSGGTLFLLILASFPIFRIVAAHLKTPAAHTLWLIIFIIFYLLSAIAEEMIVISFTGFIGNAIGAVMFKLAGRGVNEGK